MRTVEPLDVEILQHNGACDVGCPHCINGQTTPTEELSFPPKALSLFELLQEYKDSRHERIRHLRASVGSDARLAARPLPISHFPIQVGFSFGKFPELSDVSSVASAANQMAATINSCLGDQQPSPKHPTSVSCIFRPEVDDNLEFKDIRKVALFFRALFDTVMSKTNIPWAEVEMHMAHTHIPKRYFQQGEARLSNRLNILGVLDQMAKAALHGLPISSDIMNHHANSFESNYLVSNTLANGGVAATLSTRFISRIKDYSLPTAFGSRDLDLTLLPDEVWVEHSTLHPKDTTSRMNYDEIEEIVQSAMTTGDTIGKEIFKRLEGRRKSLPVVAEKW